MAHNRDNEHTPPHADSPTRRRKRQTLDDRDREHDRKKRKHKHRKDKSEHTIQIVDDDVEDEDMWVERNIDMDGERSVAADIPTAESLKLTSHVSGPVTHANPSYLTRDDWMLEPLSVASSNPSAGVRLSADESLVEGYGGDSGGKRTLGGGVDFFSSLGREVKRKDIQPDKPDPEKLRVSSRELNTQFKEGKSLDQYETPAAQKAITPGGPGSQWRMMKLRRLYETAEEEGRRVEDLALERFGSLEAFEQAKQERRVLDARADRKSVRDQSRDGKDGEKRWMFSDFMDSGASSRSSSFKRPGGPGTPSTPSPTPGPSTLKNRRFDSLRLPSEASTPLSQSHTPVPSVMTPPAARLQIAQPSSGNALTPSELNKIQAKVLRAKLSGAPNAEDLEREYEAAKTANLGHPVDATSYGPSSRTHVQVMPTLDARGRMYDVGHGKDEETQLPGNRRKQGKYVETRDPKTGELVRYNADDDSTTLGEMLREEKFGAGMADQKNIDAELAGAIMRDGKFEDDLEYMDDNAEKLGRKKMRTDAMKRQFAINDFKKTQKSLAACKFCYGDDDSLPKAAIIAMGTRCYLACTLNQELADGHCLIVPIQHHLTMLEGDDDVWDEVRNFMKCLMRMYAEEGKGAVFYETVLSIKHQHHTFIECVPLSWEHFEEVPAYFRESILASETEWTQHKKLIDFSTRPGGFRRAMVPNLPYFMVQFDHKGEKGYGHVIEGVGDAAGAGEEDGAVDEGDKGGGDFPRWFAGEIIGNILEVEPRRWRRPKRIDYRHNDVRSKEFRKKYAQFDWTPMIGRS